MLEGDGYTYSRSIEGAAEGVTPDPAPRVELDQGLRLIRALYQDKDAFHLLAVTEKGAESIYRPEIRGKMAQSRTGRMYRLARTGWESPGIRFLDRLDAHIRNFIAKWNEVEKFSAGVHRPSRGATHGPRTRAVGDDGPDLASALRAPEAAAPPRAPGHRARACEHGRTCGRTSRCR